MTNQIPKLYRILFTWIDPINAGMGALLYFFDRDTVISSFIPNSTRNPDHDLLFFQLGGNMACIAFLQAVLLRYTSDINIWKFVNGAILLVDIAMLAGIYNGLGNQGRLQPSVWRWEDWTCIAITGFVTFARSLFISGVGLGRKRKAA